MNDEISSIWFRINGRGRKNILVGGVYREHTLLGTLAPANSAEPREQRRRWMTFLRQWKFAGQRLSSCIVTGDTNIDKLRWDTPEANLSEMVQDTKEEIETGSFVQLI